MTVGERVAVRVDRSRGGGLDGFRRMLAWCAGVCGVVPTVLLLVGVPGLWILRSGALLLTALPAAVTWWACSDQVAGRGPARPSALAPQTAPVLAASDPVADQAA
jgi:hypothetical protein